MRSYSFLKSIGIFLSTICLSAIFTGSIGILPSITDISEFALERGIVVTKEIIYGPLIGVALLGVFSYSLGYFLEYKSRKNVKISTRRFRTIEDLRQLYSVLDNYAETALVPIDFRYVMMKKNPNCFHICEVKKFDGTVEIVGFVMIFFLNKKSVSQVLAGTKTGYEIRDADVVSRHTNPSGCYIGFLWASDHMKIHKPISARVLKQAAKIIRTNCKKPKNFHVFARPTTGFAATALKRRNFLPLPSSQKGVELDNVCYRILGALR